MCVSVQTCAHTDWPDECARYLLAPTSYFEAESHSELQTCVCLARLEVSKLQRFSCFCPPWSEGYRHSQDTQLVTQVLGSELLSLWLLSKHFLTTEPSLQPIGEHLYPQAKNYSSSLYSPSSPEKERGAQTSSFLLGK